MTLGFVRHWIHHFRTTLAAAMQVRKYLQSNQVQLVLSSYNQLARYIGMYLLFILLLERCSQLLYKTNGDMECCTEQTKCRIGEGDCDNDDQCMPGLKCGSSADNCKMFDPAWVSNADCCYQRECTA